MRLFCDQDGVLVHQTSRKRWDLMDWMPDGRKLWEALKPYSPVILTQLMMDVWEISRHEKRIWVDREIGPDVEVIVVHGEDGKFPYSGPGHVLIDDSIVHKEPWEKRGGIFILHKSADESIAALRAVVGE
jgi:hypothetical protein